MPEDVASHGLSQQRRNGKRRHLVFATMAKCPPLLNHWGRDAKNFSYKKVAISTAISEGEADKQFLGTPTS
jgi:hypothetical protein